MEAQELQMLVRAALQTGGAACCGFQVAPEASKSRKKRIPRLVPLSVACKAPELLTGRVSALMAPSNDSGRALGPEDTRQEIAEAATGAGDGAAADATANTRPEKKDRKEDTRTTKKDRQEDTLQAELVAKKVVAIGRRVFSPQVQTQVLALADTTRHKWSLGEEGSNVDEGRFADTMQLLNMLEKLLDRHVLPEDHGAHLLELVLGGNRQEEQREAHQTNGSPAKKRMRNAAAAVPSAVSVVRSLHAQHMLTSLELDIIQALVAQDDSQVLQLLRDFEQSDHRDVSALRDALVSIVEEITMELGDEEKAAAAFARGLDDAWQAQHLTPTDANTLRRMVAQQHNLLESAYEVFAGLLVLFHGGNEALQAANEAFQADGDVHELEETLLLVVKHARFGTDDEPIDEGQAVSRLLAEYGRSGRLELWQIQLLMCLLKAHDPRLLAAVDVYNEDKNAEELIETLEILVELAAWERHRHAIVHDWIAPLARGGNLPRGGAERLLQLVKVRDDRVVAALVVYLSDGNKEEFVDTLTRIACLEAMKLKNVMADAKRNESEEGHLVLALLEELEDKGVMTADEREHVEELVCSGDARMLAAMDVLAATHDAEDFADTARRILAKLKQKEIVMRVSKLSGLSVPGKEWQDASPVAEPQETSQEVASEESEQVDEQEQKEEQAGKDEEIVTDQVEEDSTEEVEKVARRLEDAKDEGENEGKANVEEIELAQ
ncbi:uncharacterized protein KRP23_15193 [Phytophthora ramorum]|uniref:uncharacterized protein n=1 Tax=Phytophthora ramorum TaxID=164328 RepID=UPI0030AD39E8|nr:hypothetical protein KRP23_15193 [Phytophthora ramorum]